MELMGGRVRGGFPNRALSLWGFFNVGFGAVIGSCWLLLIGDWMIEGGGPVSVVAAFLLGMVLMVPIGSVFGELSAALPFTGGPTEFVARTHGELASTVVGWAFVLGNGIVPAWDTLTLSAILTEVIGPVPGFSWLCGIKLYTVFGYSVYLIPSLVAVAVVIFVGKINMDSSLGAARIQLFLSYVQLVGMVVVLVAAIAHGSPANASPSFAQITTSPSIAGVTEASTPLGGLLAVLAVTPYFFAGFDAVSQRADEAAEGVNWNKFGKVIVLTILASAGFYIVTAYSFGTIEPWQEFVSHRAPAFTALAAASPFAYIVVLVVAVFCPIGPMNSFVGATNFVLLSMARRGQIPARIAEVDPRTGTQRNAYRIVIATAVLGPFLGTGMLELLAKVASLALSVSYLMISLSCLRMRQTEPDLPRPFRVPAGNVGVMSAALASAFCIGILVVPTSPAAIGPSEWAIVVIWSLLGIALSLVSRRRARSAEPSATGMRGA